METKQTLTNNNGLTGIVSVIALALTTCLVLATPELARARDIESKGSEMQVYVSPGEPTELKFPSRISGGVKRKNSSVAIDRKDDAMVVFASEGLAPQGEALIVRLDDGRSFSIRVNRASPSNPRDSQVVIRDTRGALIASSSEDEKPYLQKNYEYAPATQVAGLMREMVLVAELGKRAIPGYRVSEEYTGQVVLDDGTLVAKVDKIFMGPNLWGYVLEAENRLDQSQKLNPASFRIDGTRAVSASNWELAAKPLTVEQQVAGKEKTKIYIVARARPNA